MSMLVMREDELERFCAAADVLGAGDLLIYQTEQGLCFGTERIYCAFAGYDMLWKDFIGFQNVLFYAGMDKMQDIISCEGAGELLYKTEKEKTEFFERSAVFGMFYHTWEYTEKNVVLCETVNQIVHDMREFYQSLESASIKRIEDMSGQQKKETYDRLIPLYAKLLLFKALHTPRLCETWSDTNKKTDELAKPAESAEFVEKLTAENIEKVWHRNEVRE